MRYVYPGSFDPITNGHVDIILRSLKLCPALIVAVLDNPSKRCLFSAGERAELISRALKGHNAGKKIEVDVFSGLLAEYAIKKQAAAIIRGLRSPLDYENEYRYAEYNKILSMGVETVFLPSSPKYSYISSSIVKEAAAYLYKSGLENDKIGEWVPKTVAEALKSKLNKG